jgi:hypothetical protein
MPLDDGCRLDQHHGVEDLWLDSIKPHPEQPVGGEEPRAARALPTQNSHLVSQSNEFKFQRCAAAHPEREQGTDSGQKGDHADDGMGSAQETLHLVGGFDFCAGTGPFGDAEADICRIHRAKISDDEICDGHDLLRHRRPDGTPLRK